VSGQTPQRNKTRGGDGTKTGVKKKSSRLTTISANARLAKKKARGSEY